VTLPGVSMPSNLAGWRIPRRRARRTPTRCRSGWSAVRC